MTPAEARHFLHTCNDQIEAGVTPELRRRILEAHAIVAADLEAQRQAMRAEMQARRAARQAQANG